MSMTMAPIQSRDLLKYISRCVVCETTTRTIALHSQSMSIPDCPNGWEEMWTGYSYLMTTTDNAGGFGQNLVSPGSCLEEFRSNPIIECHGHGRCNYYDPLASFWLAVIEEHQQWLKPVQQTLKADQTSKVSRCTVCRRRNDSYISRLTPVASSATEFRRGAERVAPAPVQVRPAQYQPAQYQPTQYQPQPQAQPVPASQYPRQPYNPNNNNRRPNYGYNNNYGQQNRGGGYRVRRPREDTYSP